MADLIKLETKEDVLNNAVKFSPELNALLKKMWTIYYTFEPTEEEQEFYKDNLYIMVDYYENNYKFWIDQHQYHHVGGA